MKISGSHALRSSRVQVWPLISDPASLARLIPGCERLEETAPGEFRGQVQIPVAAVAGVYETFVRLENIEEPFVTRFIGEMTGPAGALSGTATFRLVEDGPPGGCLLSYEGDALITGPLGRMDGRFTEGVARAMIGQGLHSLDAEIQRAAPPTEAAAAVPETTQASWLSAIKRWFAEFAARLRSLPGRGS
jgi:hypothetical protein